MTYLPIPSDSQVFSYHVFNWIVGEKIDHGMSREVYRFGPDDSKVIKIEFIEGKFQNAIEWDTWDRIQHTDFAKWFAPCRSISADGRFLLQDYAEPICDLKGLPDRVPAFFTDLKISNWGLIKGRPVCVDYGRNLLPENGMTSRTRKANWWIENV